MASEDGASRAFIKEKKDYLEDLKNEIQYFYDNYNKENS